MTVCKWCDKEIVQVDNEWRHKPTFTRNCIGGAIWKERYGTEKRARYGSSFAIPKEPDVTDAEVASVATALRKMLDAL